MVSVSCNCRNVFVIEDNLRKFFHLRTSFFLVGTLVLYAGSHVLLINPLCKILCPFQTKISYSIKNQQFICMYVCKYVCVHRCVCICACLHSCVCLHVYACMQACMHCMYVCSMYSKDEYQFYSEYSQRLFSFVSLIRMIP